MIEKSSIDPNISMSTFYTGEEVPDDLYPCIFLAGPTPRIPEVPSWRPAAAQALVEAGFNGHILIPEWRDGRGCEFITQVGWEKDGLTGNKRHTPTVILFWVAREMKFLQTEENIEAFWANENIKLTMPALTTNVEFGRYVDSGRIIYGRPDDSPHCDYLDWLYHDATGKYPCRTLPEAAKQAVNMISGMRLTKHGWKDAETKEAGINP